MGEFIGEDDEFEYYHEEIDDESANIICKSATETTDDPKTYTDAMTSPDSKRWKIAISEELDSHERCGTWKLAKRSDLRGNTPY